VLLEDGVTVELQPLLLQPFPEMHCNVEQSGRGQSEDREGQKKQSSPPAGGGEGRSWGGSGLSGCGGASPNGLSGGGGGSPKFARGGGKGGFTQGGSVVATSGLGLHGVVVLLLPGKVCHLGLPQCNSMEAHHHWQETTVGLLVEALEALRSPAEMVAGAHPGLPAGRRQGAEPQAC
jgi:hypothetical protein